MRIVHYSHCNLGSAEASTAHVMEFAERLNRRGHDVTVVTPKKGRYRYATACDMRYFGYFNLKGFRQITAMANGFLALLLLHASKRFDCIYIRNLPFDIFPALFSKLTAVPLVVETNGQAEIFEFEVPVHAFWRIFWLPLLRLIEHTLFAAAFAVTADGQARFEHFKRSYPSRRPRYHMVRSGGIDLEKFRPVDRAQSRLELGLPIERTIAVWVGTIFAWSGLEIILDAAHTLRDQRPELLFLIIGNGPDRERLEHEAQSRGLTDNTMFTGYIDTLELYRWLSASDVALAPYTRLRLDREDFTSYKIFEYLACGLPVVCSYERGSSNIGYVNEYDFGRTVPPQDPAAFRTALERVLATPEYFQIDFVARARRTLQELGVTWDALVDQIELLCRDAVQTTRR